MPRSMTGLLANCWQRFCPVPRVRRGPLPVMFVLTSMPVGGAETLLANLLEGLDPKRIKPEIVCLKSPGPLGEKLKQKFPVHSRLLTFKWDIRVLPRLVSLFRKRNVAAVVTVGAGDKMFWGRLAAWIAGVPTIFSALHSTGWPDGVGKLNRLLTPITDGFIAVADAHAEHMRENEGFPEKRVFTIRNGVDSERFHKDPEARAKVRSELGIAEDSPVIGIVAALRPEKNHTMFLRAARAIIEFQPQVKFLIVGDGPEKRDIEKSIERLGLQTHVYMLGTRHDTPDLLNAMDVFVLSSLNEASPVSILEALACQVPVVATNVGSVCESVIDGQTGYLVDVDDDRTLIGCLLALVDDPLTRETMGANGRALVCESASLVSMIEGYSELIESQYDELAQRKNPPELLIDRRRFPRDLGADLNDALEQAAAKLTPQRANQPR